MMLTIEMIAAVVILILFCTPVFLMIWSNFSRFPRDPRHLTPNCLLTRSPVVFVTGSRSPFYFRHYWNDLPRYLSAHGYDVRVLRLPWRGTEKRRLWMYRLLQSTPCHLIVDSSSAFEFSELLTTLPVRSVFIPQGKATKMLLFSWIERIHHFWLRALKVPQVSLQDLNVNSVPETRFELLRFIRREAEREWTAALQGSEIPVEHGSKS